MAHSIVIFRAKLLQTFAARLRNEKRREAPKQHEQGENLQNVIQPRIRIGLGRSARAQRGNSALSYDGPNLTRRG